MKQWGYLGKPRQMERIAQASLTRAGLMILFMENPERCYVYHGIK